jgi:hypothetical protein
MNGGKARKSLSRKASALSVCSQVISGSPTFSAEGNFALLKFHSQRSFLDELKKSAAKFAVDLQRWQGFPGLSAF